ncbi:MAG TPA: PadR family transcriptional regulator [Gemmatimonadaceae bacterium]|jgi:transcriptional regulator|nr:PadR family transcriptional regulator [Gemmatimonadaceae bacterium]
MAGSDLYTGTLDVLILKALSWGPMHGYAMGRWIRQTTDEELQVQEGALYPALHRLQRRGWLAEEWGLTETNREAKYYSLTPAGRKALREEIARWNRYSRAVSAALRTRGAEA